MSKIGDRKIIIPRDVNIDVNNRQILIKGKEGSLSYNMPIDLEAIKGQDFLEIKAKNNTKKTRSLHGLYRQLIANAVVGVQKPWEKRLEIVGTGYGVKLQGEDLVFKLGFSHPVVFKKISGIKYQVEGNNKVIVYGVDKQLVGQVAYKIKMLRKPDVYKGKGIRYEGEKLRIKPGKKVKTTTVGAAT